MALTIRKFELLVPAAVVLVGIASAFYLYSSDKYSLLYYGDSISHLVAGRKLVDWQNPGIYQLGTVWLPLLHVVLIPPALNDFLFASGLAGTVINLPSLILASFYITRMAYNWFKSEKIATLTGLIFALNPSVIYMGIVPMQESLFLFFAVSSAYYAYAWYENTTARNLYIAAILTILATLTRYEGWFLPIALAVLAASKIRTESIRVNLINFLCVLASFAGIVFWFLWNALAFGDPLAFINIPFYSYLAQATSRPFRESLYLQPLSSAQILSTAMEVMYGAPLLIISLIGLIAFAAKKGESKNRMIFVALLALPLAVIYISLVLGLGEIFHQGGGIWFNSRFLVLASSIVSFGSVAVGVPKKKLFVIILAAIIVLSTSFGAIRQLGYPNPPMVMKEAYAGFSYRNETFSAIETAKILQHNFNDGTILMLTSSGDAHKIMIFSGIHLVNFRDLFAGEPWPLVNESRSFNKFVIVSNRPSGDAINGVRFIENNSILLNEKYEIIYHNEFYTLMKLKSS
ncbi:MAG: hypothetical protein HYY67_04720 [Thaumarchaeota archaeon]|nr:hypothetical protein [Nitrososphaerota archaeon]